MRICVCVCVCVCVCQAVNGASPAIGAQAMQGGVPMTEPMNATSERKQFGITLGYQYGVCFVLFPTPNLT